MKLLTMLVQVQRDYGSLRGEGAKIDVYVKYTALENMYNNGQIDSADFGTKINESRNTTGVAPCPHSWYCPLWWLLLLI